MKKLLLILLFTTSIYSQPYLSIGLDVRNALAGSNPTNNKPEFDLFFNAGAIGSMGSIQEVRIGLIYENFNRIEFSRYAVEVGKKINLSKFVSLTPTIEYGWVQRYGNHSFFSHGANLYLNHEFINEDFEIGLNFNVLKRNDLDAMYGGNNYKISNYLLLTYKFN